MVLIGLCPTGGSVRVRLSNNWISWLLSQRWYNWSDSEKRRYVNIIRLTEWITITPTMDGVWIQAAPESFSDKNPYLFFVQLSKEKNVSEI